MASEINVNVKLYGVLRRHRPDSAPGSAHDLFTVNPSKGMTVTDLGKEWGINPSAFSAIAINGEAADEHTLLSEGDEIRIFPPSAGG